MNPKLEKKCPKCNGHGERYIGGFDRIEECRACHGTGRVIVGYRKQNEEDDKQLDMWSKKND